MRCADCDKVIPAHEPHYLKEDGRNEKGNRVFLVQCSLCNYIEVHG